MHTSKSVLDLLKNYCRFLDEILGCQEEYQDCEDLVALLAKSKQKHKYIMLLDEKFGKETSKKIARYWFDAKCIERFVIIDLNKSLEA